MSRPTGPVEHAPTGIQHGLGHPGFRQFQAAHIADDDGLILVDNFPGEPVQGVLPPPRRRAMEALGLTLMTPALRGGDLLLDVATRL
jgi:hypothetical protein